MRSSRVLVILIPVLILSACSDQLIDSTEYDEVGRIGQSQQIITSPFEVGPDVSPPFASKMADVTTDCTFKLKSKKSGKSRKSEKGGKKSGKSFKYTKWELENDCTTDGTLFIPDGFELDGKKHTITAIDPPGGHFKGAIVMNGGVVASVKNLTITTADLANVSDGGGDRLRGIMFEGASGKIEKNTIIGINQGASGSQEGNAIEVRNAPFDGSHPNTQTVSIKDNTIEDYQKTGIVANGDVDVTIEHNYVGASATQANLAANSIQLGFGALGSAKHNDILGNQWMGTSNWVATAMLIYAADSGLEVSHNKFSGNSDIGLYVYADGGLYEKNKVYDEGTDDVNSSYDIGIGDWGTGNVYNHNSVCGFDIPFVPDPLPGKKNKVCN
jgi:hypothetical protein